MAQLHTLVEKRDEVSHRHPYVLVRWVPTVFGVHERVLERKCFGTQVHNEAGHDGQQLADCSKPL